MQLMGWSWPDLCETPPYVRRFCWDIGNVKRRVQAGRAANKGGSGDGQRGS